MIDRNTIDRIFAAADIVEVIGEFVNLKRAGQNFRGLSPFKNEKTPSFFVSPAKGIFKCFSTGIGGNVVNFLMEHEKITYPEALKYLANKYHIDIIEKEESAEERQLKNERESLLAVNQFACQYYMETLRTAEGKAIGLSYFVERGFREDTIQKFQLGYSREDKHAFTRTAIEKGYKQEYLVKTGLTIQHESNGYDRFHGRVIFPIHGLTGQILGFAGRVMKTEEKTAKYLNSPESDVYHKSDILYGLYLARQPILKSDKCFLVEGYTDVISMHQSGIENVVASSGTSLTINQIRLIKRFTRNITVLYDGDEAGIKASLRGIDLLLEEGLNVRVVLLPDGEDPDSYARKNNSQTFTAFIQKHESDFISFKTQLLRKEAESDPIKRAGLITEIVRTISVIPESITRSVYIRECSKLLDTDEKLLYAETAKLRRNRNDQRAQQADYKEYVPADIPATPVSKEPLKESYPAEKEVIRLFLIIGNHLFTVHDQENKQVEMKVADYVIQEILHDELEFHDPVYNRFYTEICTLPKEPEPNYQDYFVRHPDANLSALTASLITSSYDLSRIWKKRENYVETEEMRLKENIPETILAFKIAKVLNMLKNAENDLKFAQEQNDEEKIRTLQTRFMILNNLKMTLAKGLGERVILHTH